MAAPVATKLITYGFRDAKANTSRLRVVIGGATSAAVDTDAVTLLNHLVLVTNANVYLTIDANPADKRTNGGTGQFQNSSDKAKMTFTASDGSIHRYQIPAPLAAIFKADLETVDKTVTAIAAVITDFQTFCYGAYTDTSPLAFVAGVRTRTPMPRRSNIFTLQPDLTGPEE